MKKTILAATILTVSLASTGSAAIVLSDSFTYADGPLIGNIPPVGPGLAWNTHSGATPGQVNVLSNAVFITQAETEDVNAPIAPTGFAFQAGVVVAATFDISFSVLPTGAGTYFTHFKDATASGFRARLFALTTGAAVGTFRLGIADIGTAVNTLAVDLLLSTTYSITLSNDTSTGKSSFSVNAGPVTTATDAATPLPISSFAFRQSTNEGAVTVDNLVVDANGAETPIIPEPTTALTLVSGLGVLGLLRRRSARA